MLPDGSLLSRQKACSALSQKRVIEPAKVQVMSVTIACDTSWCALRALGREICSNLLVGAVDLSHRAPQKKVGPTL
ncbi:hypothetical protein PCAR4_1050024 [Paraburkholderia caribensis]|nr:hypothetical protein PCAR4_1050024 [Paraburkholderia caribensis]